MDPAFEPIRTEINVKLGQGQYAPAVKSDVAAVAGDEPALAQRIDAKSIPACRRSQPTWRGQFLAHAGLGDSAGDHAEQLKLSVCSPASSRHSSSRPACSSSPIPSTRRPPGRALRFMVEPNLTMIVRRTMRDIDAAEVRPSLPSESASYSASARRIQRRAFPAGPYEVPDEVGDGRPLLVVKYFVYFLQPVFFERFYICAYTFFCGGGFISHWYK